MTRDELITALETRRAKIQAAWLRALPVQGSPEYMLWLTAYGIATARCARAFVWLR